MFRFLLVLALMALSFLMGKISAQENADFTVVYELPALETDVTDRDISGLIPNQSFREQYPRLYHELVVFLAVPAVQNALLPENRNISAIFQKFIQYIAWAKSL